jgi:hypothetical protein
MTPSASVVGGDDAAGVGQRVVIDAIAAVQQVINALLRIPQAVRSYVDAFNPTAGQQLDRAFRSVAATIGYALEPVILAATRIVDSFAGALLGAMNSLRRPVELVSQAFRLVLRPAIDAVSIAFDGLAKAAEGLTPLLEPLSAAAQMITTTFGIVTAVALELVAGLTGALGEVVPSMMNLHTTTVTLTGVFVEMTRIALRWGYVLSNLVGLGKHFRDALEAFTKQRPQAGRPGAVGFGMGGLEDLYRRRLVEAAKATGGKSIEEKQFDVTSQIRDMMKEMLDQIKKQEEAAGPNREADDRAKHFLRQQPAAPLPGRQEQRNAP